MKKTAFNLRLSQAWLPPKILLIMKLIIIIMTACLMQVSAAGFAQKITYSKKGATLEQIFSEIRKQTGYYVVYAENKVNKEAKLDVNFRNTELNKVLDVISNSQNLEYSLDDKNISLKPKEESVIDRIIARFQAIDVRGKVVDSLGNGLPGATVTIRNGKGSTSTSANGDFNLKNVEEGAVLVFSYLGYITKEQTVSKDFMYVQLQMSTSKLDEVQVMAYGKISRRLNTGNIVTVTAEEIERQPINNPLLALQGRVSGLEIVQNTGLPGGNLKIRLRGSNSINNYDSNANKLGTGEPLFIIDGLPYTNGLSGLGLLAGDIEAKISAFNFINPADIESIDVLKDIDATAIYGSRGANGVILINTKKGNVGKTKFDVSFKLGYSDVARKARLLSKDEYIEMRLEALNNASINIKDPSVKERLFDVFSWNGNTDWQEKMIGGNAQYSNFQTAISGGGNNLQHTFGVNYHKETTVFPGKSGDNKANVRFGIIGRSTDKKFEASFHSSFMSNWNNYPGEDFTKYISLAPTAPDLLRSDGSLNWAPIILSPAGAQQVTFYTLSANPFALLLQPYESKVSNLVSSAEFIYRISKFTFRTSLGYNELNGQTYKAINPYRSKAPNYIEPRQATFSSNGVNSLIVEPQINYKVDGSTGKLEVLAGASYQSSSTSLQNIGATGFLNDDLMKSQGAASHYTTSNDKSEYKYAGFFGRIAYNLKDKYLLNLNFRRDGSSRFGPGKQYGNFGSIGAAWIFSEGKQLEKLFPFMSYGKIRFSYGIAGSDGIGDYQYLERYSNVAGSYLGVKGFATLGLFNRDYRWEETKKAELALDLGFVDDRVLLQIAHYQNVSSNQLTSLPLAEMVGYGNIVVNSDATVKNTGLELDVNIRHIVKRDFKWSNSINFSFNRNKLLAFPDLENSIYRNQYRIGLPIGLPRVWRYIGVNPGSGTYEFLDKHGNPTPIPSPEDATSFINVDPKFFLGLTNNFSFRGFEVNLLFQFVKQIGKNYLFNFPVSPGIGDVTNILSNQPIEVIRSHWRSPGDIAIIKKYYTNNNDFGSSNVSQSDRGYADASFLRLKNFSISYQFSKKSPSGLRNLRICIEGQNLLTISGFKGLDPENQSVTSLPPLRVITTGINLNF